MVARGGWRSHTWCTKGLAVWVGEGGEGGAGGCSNGREGMVAKEGKGRTAKEGGAAVAGGGRRGLGGRLVARWAPCEQLING